VTEYILEPCARWRYDNAREFLEKCEGLNREHLLMEVDEREKEHRGQDWKEREARFGKVPAGSHDLDWDCSAKKKLR
jgi:hypothetical protein